MEDNMNGRTDDIGSSGGVFLIVAGLGLLCCGLPLLLAAGAGGTIGFLGSGTGVGALAAVAIVGVVGYLIYRNRARSSNVGNWTAVETASVSDDREVGDWHAMEDCCAPQWEAPRSKEEKDAQTERNVAPAGEVAAGTEKRPRTNVSGIGNDIRQVVSSKTQRATA